MNLISSLRCSLPRSRGLLVCSAAARGSRRACCLGGAQRGHGVPRQHTDPVPGDRGASGPCATTLMSGDVGLPCCAWEEEETGRAESPRSDGTVYALSATRQWQRSAIAFFIKTTCCEIEWVKDVLYKLIPGICSTWCK